MEGIPPAPCLCEKAPEPIPIVILSALSRLKRRNPPVQTAAATACADSSSSGLRGLVSGAAGYHNPVVIPLPNAIGRNQVRQGLQALPGEIGKGGTP